MPIVSPDRTLRRVLVIAAVDGWSVTIFAGLCTLASLVFGEWLGVSVGTTITVAGMLELRGRAKLAGGDVAGIKQMAAAQLMILGTISLYAFRNILAFDATTLMSGITPELRSALSQYGLSLTDLQSMLHPVYVGIYCVIIALTALFQGGLALYYLSRREKIAEALASARDEMPPRLPGVTSPPAASISSRKQPPTDPNIAPPPLSSKSWSYRSVTELPEVQIEGIPWWHTERHWDRLPRALMQDGTLRPALRHVAAQQSGGRIRFRTTADTWSLRARLARTETCVHNTVDSLSGLDCYARPAGDAYAETRPMFVRCAAPGEDPASIVAEIKRPARFSGEVEWTVYFPLQNPLASLELAFPDDAQPTPPAAPRLSAPVVFHGSSITQGFSCTRPGLTYPAIIARELDIPFVNLGYGGNAKGDPEVAAAIAALPMSVFVCDLDFNFDKPEDIAARHAAFVATIRRAHPTVPILCVSAPNYWNEPAYFGHRASLIEKTVLDARASGDTRIEFLHGKSFWDADRAGDFTIDLIHPNDLGFARMAEHIGVRVGALLARL